MILIDPELKISRAAEALNPDSARPSAGPVAGLGSKLLRLPSTRTMARFLTLAQTAVRLRGQVTVLVTGDAAMRDLNRRFRGKDQATDVLSFRSEHLVRGTENIAGDVAISVETAIRQCVEQGHSLTIEIKVLMLHGLLHLAGYDHEADAGEMQRRERSLRAKLGLPLGLIERAGSPALFRRGGQKDGARGSRQQPSGAKAPTLKSRGSARLKSRPDTKRGRKP